jgi:hypothetical protein
MAVEKTNRRSHMKRYSLEQLSVFAEHGMGRARLLDLAQFCGHPPGSAMGYSDRMRAGDVIGLYHEHGEEIGADIEKYIDHVLARHSQQVGGHASAEVGETYSLGELCWVRAVGMFSGDVKTELLELGVEEPAAASVSVAACAAQGDVVQWWRLAGAAAAPALHVSITKTLQSYRAGWPFAKASVAHADAGSTTSSEHAL